MAEKAEETFEDFDTHLNTIVQGGYITLAITMGVDTGLFGVMCEMDGPKTSQEIADLAGLKERYVREWLGAMVMARIVDLSGENKDTYFIPSHRIPALKPGSGKNGMSLFARGVPMLSSVHKDIVQCFSKDGPTGVDYSKYADFHGFMATYSSGWFDHHLIQDFVPGVAGLKEKLEAGIQVLDLGCGEGGAALRFAQNFPKSHVYGLDFQQECVTKATKKAAEKGITNITFVCQDAATMNTDWTGKFDYIFLHETLHDQAYPDKVLDELNRVMKPDGLLSVIDTSLHTKHADNVNLGMGASLGYVCSMMNCIPVSMNFEGGMGLGAAWGQEKAKEMFSEAGFDCTLKPATKSRFMHYQCKKK